MSKIERNACRGWEDFRISMEEIWNTYSKYGEVVLEKDLEENDEKFKTLFRKANSDKCEFLRIIRKFWENNYHFIASDFKGLINLLRQYREEGRCDTLELLPETGSYRDCEIQGCDQRFSITKELYDQVTEQLSKQKVGETVLVVDYDTKQLIEIRFSEYESSKVTYHKLHVHECCKVIET